MHKSSAGAESAVRTKAQSQKRARCTEWLKFLGHGVQKMPSSKHTKGGVGDFIVQKDGRFVMGHVTIMRSLARCRGQNGDNT